SRAKADGVVTPAERAKLDRELDRNSGAIFNQKHDAQIGPAAQTGGVATPGVDQRILNQEKRIQQGENTGQLTEREANRMNNHLTKIEKDEAKAKSDGVVTPQERKKLNKELNKNSRSIY